MSPMDIELYYDRGQVKRNLSAADADGAKKDLLYFLDHADKDHRKIPSGTMLINVICSPNIAYYTLSLLFFTTDVVKSQHYFDLGQQAEENLLPFFKPYEFSIKTTMEKFLLVLDSMKNKKRDSESQSNLKSVQVAPTVSRDSIVTKVGSLNFMILTNSLAF